MGSDWLRWTVPPGISLLVHAGLIGAVAYIGMQISAAQTPKERLPVAELALPAPPQIPETTPAAQDPAPPVSNPMPAVAAPTPAPPDAVASQARALGEARVPIPEMDPVARASMEQAAAQVARPESAAPPSVRFAGVQSRAARTIVYVVDGSGATANSFAYLRAQLMGSIDRLSPTQRFQVVLFRSSQERDTELAPIGNGRLARATPRAKHAVDQWLSTVSARGRSDPLAGLEAALALKPDLVLLVTRSIQRTEMGWAQGQREILTRLNELNPADPISGQRPTVIKTVQLLDDDPTGIMLAIGTMHGDGHDDYRVVPYDELVKGDERADDLSTRSIGASDEQRIAAAGEIMGSLAASGASFSVLYSVGDASQRDQAMHAAHQVRSLISGLVDLDGRAALLEAQATLLARAVDPGSVPDAQLQRIIDTLGSVMYTEPNTDAQRVMAVAQARAQLGQGPRAIKDVHALLDIGDDLGLDAPTRAQGLLMLVSLGEEPSALGTLGTRAPFVTASGGIDAVWGLLLREATTRSRLARGQQDAWSPMLKIRRAAASDASIVAYIDGRIALLYTAGGDLDDARVPSGVLLAAANAMSRSKDQRERAMTMLGEVAGRTDDRASAVEALWAMGVLGRAINSDASIERSNRALTRLAEEFPDDPRAQGAIASAIGAGGDDDGPTRRDRLRLAIERFGDAPQVDLWRLELADLLDGFERLDVLDPVAPDTREGVLAGELYERTVLAMLERYDDPQIRRGLSVRMGAAAERFGMSSAALWTKRAATSQAAIDPGSAIASIDELIRRAREQKSPTTELELTRAQTLLRLGQTRAAFSALRELSERIDASGRRTSTYWQAWAMMLESVASHGDPGDRSEALGHIARLSLIDPDLGGSPWRERITDARKTLHSTP